VSDTEEHAIYTQVPQALPITFPLLSPFLSRFCDILKLGHKHDSFVWLLQASKCCVLRVHRTM